MWGNGEYTRRRHEGTFPGVVVQGEGGIVGVKLGRGRKGLDAAVMLNPILASQAAWRRC